MSAPVPFLAQLDYSVLQQCMHCGLCLPTCPTYVYTNLERHSPRGRISLMRAIADREMDITKLFGEEMYFCLGCLACTTACPAGVNYPELFETARADIEKSRVLTKPKRNFVRWFLLDFVFTRPTVLRALGKLIYFFQFSGLQTFARRIRLVGLLPKDLRDLEPLTPAIASRFSDTLIRRVETTGHRRFRVGFLTGCVQDLAFSDVNRDTVDVLIAHDCEVLTPRRQYCCGSLHGHNGEVELAKKLARKNIEMFEAAAGSLDKLDAIITNAGGCGSHLKNYGHLLAADSDFAARAKVWSEKVKDIHEWLAQIGVKKITADCQERVTYHESCHLCHGQRISSQPRKVLQSISGIEMVELKEAQWCCGSAGIYNITQPEMSRRLLERKLDHIRDTKASIVASANPGCAIQLQSGLKRRGYQIQVKHPVSILAQAIRNQRQLPGRKKS